MIRYKITASSGSASAETMYWQRRSTTSSSYRLMESAISTLRRIMAKEFVSIKETALLLNCSDGHIRNLVGKAQKGKASHPIPFLDLDGVIVFPRVKLLEWAEQPKKKLRAVS